MTSLNAPAGSPNAAVDTETAGASRDHTRRSAVPRYARAPRQRVAMLPPRIWTVMIVVLLLLAVEAYARGGLVSSLDLIPVTDMAARSLELVQARDFLVGDLLRTLLIVAVTFVSSAILGVTTAYVMVQSTWIRQALQPYLNVFYAIPTFALYPVLVVMFGTGALPIILLAVAFSVVVVISNSLVGFDTVPAIVRKLSRSLDLNPLRHFRLILLPSALPDILAGLKLGLGYAIIAVLASEFILATKGLGNTVADAYASFNTPDMYAGVIFIAMFALGSNMLLGAALARFDWRRR
ncbi:ABC nitrate/sulfonate/bicarbonate family transporter, inner membrane subunit [Nocardioidaceae bacterium Broad-1]|nr:ABC nitrate/sulfonate/bicarbonate family transporter, inner membrane subunit [Nocardioidaceae bacterium Broad-1]